MPRLRLALLWLGLITCLLFTTAWLASVWLDFTAQLGNSAITYGLQAGSGSVLLERLTVARPSAPQWRFTTHLGRHAPKLEAWVPRLQRIAPASGRAAFTDLLIPFWLPTAIAAAPTGYLYLRHRRARHPRPDSCPHCSYPLTGLAPNSPCPECGHAPGSPRT